MGLYYFTASDKDARKHLEDTIKNPFNIGEFSFLLDESTLKLLSDNNSSNYVNMWGATPGSSNILRWGKLKAGDFILAYSEGTFLYFGEVFGKTHNTDLAREVWGSRKTDGATWEYIYFIKNLVPIELRKEEFAAFFGYRNNFTPQGFSNIDEKVLSGVIDKFGTIEDAINFLANKQLVYTSNSFNREVHQIGEKELENTIEQMTDEQFLQYIQSLNPLASIEIKEGLKKIRKYNKKVIDELKEKYQNSCQVCGESSLSEYGVSVAEAHHMELFSLTQNNKPDNIMILCPSHHRIIHKAKGVFNKKEKVIEYDNGRIDSLSLNYHL